MIVTSTIASRLLPKANRPTHRATRVIERDIYVARQLWLMVASGLFEPIFYLFSVGIGIGHLVGDVPVAGHLVSYRAFVAPAMLASTAMNGAVFACTFSVFYKLKYQRAYDAIVVTPLGVGDIVLGEIGWALIRGAFYALCFVAVMLALGIIGSWWALLSIPAAVLIGFCFAGLGMMGTSFMRSWQDFDFVTLAVMPLFLFSATFSPLSAYPSAVRGIVRITPLYQGVAMERALVLGHVGWALIGHAVYLAIAGTVGVMVAARRMGRMLLR